jgi:hypothetical protein
MQAMRAKVKKEQAEVDRARLIIDKEHKEAERMVEEADKAYSGAMSLPPGKVLGRY